MGYRYGIWDVDIDIDMGYGIWDIDMGYGISIWSYTISMWSSWISIWDILSLWWPHLDAVGASAAGVSHSLDPAVLFGLKQRGRGVRPDGRESGEQEPAGGEQGTGMAVSYRDRSVIILSKILFCRYDILQDV